jgi:hypothetical protein
MAGNRAIRLRITKGTHNNGLPHCPTTLQFHPGATMARAKSHAESTSNGTAVNLGFDAKLWLTADPEDSDEYRADNIFWVPTEARRNYPLSPRDFGGVVFANSHGQGIE